MSTGCGRSVAVGSRRARTQFRCCRYAVQASQSQGVLEHHLSRKLIRVDAVWLAVDALDMRSGTESALARVVNVFGSARPPHAYLFANRRANRMKVLVHDGVGIKCAETKPRGHASGRCCTLGEFRLETPEARAPKSTSHYHVGLFAHSPNFHTEVYPTVHG